jgi:flagellar biosynthesis protein FlhA
MGREFRRTDLLLGAAVLGILAVLVVPLPALLMDLLISVNLTLSLLVLLVAMYVRRPLEFSVFPSLLLVITLYRLSLNVAATRLILLHGGDGAGAAGRVIQGFGEYVVGGNFVVGVVLFLILVVIQFVVITKGAGRIAEVAARFTLDAMPGKQMAIDADLNAGLIAETEARARREQIAREADFYGAMDGASKFVRGDAIAAIVITVINIVGGLAVGVLQQGLPIVEALTTYTVLTIGDGLVAQLPALITSTAAGIVVTRAASESDLSRDLLGQLTVRARPLTVTAAVLGVLSVLPGLPMLPFLLPAGILGLLAYRMRGREETPAAGAPPQEDAQGPARVEETPARGAPAQGDAQAPERVEGLLPVDPLQVELGYSLLGLVDQNSTRGTGGDLLDRIRVLRRQFAVDMGFVVPAIRVRDSMSLGPSQYAFKVRGVEVARGEVYLDRLLAMNPGTAEGHLDGFEVREPTFGLPARWINKATKESALVCGYTVVDPSTVITTHLSETIRRHAATLLGRQDVQALIDKIKETHPAIVEGVVPGLLPLAVVHRVLQRLLAEGVSIRDLAIVLEVLADMAPATKDPAVLAEHARAALADAVCRPYLGADGGLAVLLLSPASEEHLAERLTRGDGEEMLPPSLAQPLLQAISSVLESSPPFETRPVVLCPSTLRRHVRRLTERPLPHLGVLSYAELPPQAGVRAVGTVEMAHAAQAV